MPGFLDSAVFPCFVPEQPDAYDDQTTAAIGSKHVEFTYNRTALRVSIPNCLLDDSVAAGGMDFHDAALEVGAVVLRAALEAQ